MSIVIQVLAATGGGFNLIVLAMALAFIDTAVRDRGADAIRRHRVGDRALVDVRLAAGRRPAMSVGRPRSEGRR